MAIPVVDFSRDGYKTFYPFFENSTTGIAIVPKVLDLSIFLCIIFIQFLSGQLIQHFNWGPSQPNGGDQHCMYIVGGYLGYQWADFHCGFEMTFLCEYKGQLISECLLGVIYFPKTNEKFDNFLP